MDRRGFLKGAVVLSVPVLSPAANQEPTPKPAPGAHVAWLKNVPLFKWIDIPNSKPWTYFVDGNGVDPSYLTKLGVTGNNYPHPPDFKLLFPPNKYGLFQTRYPAKGLPGQGRTWGSEHTTFSGMALDDARYSGKPTNLMVGGGDAHWADNTVVRFVFGVDSPRWEVAILGAHFDEIKNEFPFAQTTYDPVKYPNDNTLTSKFYDGSRRGGHNYMNFWYSGKRDWFLAFESHQYWPVDQGRGMEVSIADFKVKDATGYTRWDTRKVPVIANLPVTPAQPDQPWKQKHPITEDVWQLCNQSMVVWRQSTNTYDSVWKWKGTSWGWDDAAGGINWEDGMILLLSNYGGHDVGGAAGNKWWTFSIAESSRTVITKVTGPHAATIKGAPRGHGCIWCPDLQRWLYYMGEGDPENVYTIELIDSTTIHIDKLVTIGTPSGGERNLRAGGVLNNLQYCQELKGVVWIASDRQGIKFMRTA